ncbi:hypothetical protein K4K49_010155 [Colletotrichum sp. SAR 10_70]|nr:hypothetical protein KHU50_006187 [Colletotrichum sp. SAR 10_65]KAI8170358.1 hypothetical protein K4K50_008109 [Colletotrichum sp. SAR 10_71]KAI8182472.1 hypothetical protein K4K51_000982 [Colletotrichum sp. SAR 10_75]KAI8194086.1 hypothetical protein K4K49_010155 [Colletotrichum sp. SAR 10_70]KAI8225481.1 hypothetical protein K4K53_006393 [Colletotrichum sp. SAR 10_77]KAJ5001091.1 hypothetical protein K4K48_001878 [Colletotrichum sp. SAR 10_66]
MIFQHLCVFLLAVIPLTSAAVIRPFAKNNAYWVDVTKSRGGQVWDFAVYGDGYAKFDDDGDRKNLDYVEVDTTAKRLTVHNAQNAYDTTKPRLKMREVLKECWTMTSLQPAELKEVAATWIQNDDMNKALADCRTELNKGPRGNFEVSATDGGSAQQACWARLGKTIFAASITGAIADFDINKKLVKMEVTNSWTGDDLLFTFSA